jgi:hypothetical protein
MRRANHIASEEQHGCSENRIDHILHVLEGFVRPS